MKKLSCVLCVVDPTANVHYSIERAAWLCSKAGAKLELLVCFSKENVSDQWTFAAPSREKVLEQVMDEHLRYLVYLEKLAQPLREAGINVITTARRDGPLHEAILRYAASIHADIVIKDTHFHSTISRVLLSHTDWQLIRNCASPLWLVKPAPISDKPLFLAALDPMNEHDKPAALDDEILVSAKRIADLCGGEVHAFHAYDPRVALAAASANAYVPVSMPYDEIKAQMRETHGRRLREITDYYGLKSDRTHLVAGCANLELPAMATHLNAAVVVMGAVARNWLKRLFVGATAERTLDRLPCDLLIIKPDWFRTPAEILHHKAQAA